MHQAAVTAKVAYPHTNGASGNVRWGQQVDLRPIGDLHGPAPGVVAAYLAKYATKSTDPTGLLDHPIDQTDLDRLDHQLPAHVARVVRTTWDLGGRPELAHLRLRAWAHTLGYRGHWLTKSRRYSTTFAALRTACADWQANRNNQSTSGQAAVTVGEWHYQGAGWSTDGDAWLAATAANEALQARRTANRERRTAQKTTEGGEHG